ncbi:hypothetical protein Dsin_032190 [Dipteronia sinensis]|uniref:peroxidase n=1 Tax=Dipteronia sinensis TaxID=43782 RepID=A0AAD9ZPB6_9ROSI|nr:hypothetical protein Dsin_032190 [Dipteronia sinensis]
MMGFCQGQLKIGFYSETCPEAESIVRGFVQDVVLSNPNIAAVLLKLHFHDCFVEGCDGSILIENGPNAEKHAFGHQGVEGFEVIERAKVLLEDECGRVVSCADIVAMAARDAIALSNGPAYDVPTGRRDGEVSNVSLANDMPDVSDSIQQLRTKFFLKGLLDKDLVLLSGIYFSLPLSLAYACGGSDPAINPRFLSELKSLYPENGHVNVRLSIDRGSERTFDKQILQNIKDGFAVLESDSKLNDDIVTKSVIDSYVGFLNPILGPSFEADFVESIVKMGQIGVKTAFGDMSNKSSTSEPSFSWTTSDSKDEVGGGVEADSLDVDRQKTIARLTEIVIDKSNMLESGAVRTIVQRAESLEYIDVEEPSCSCRSLGILAGDDPGSVLTEDDMDIIRTLYGILDNVVLCAPKEHERADWDIPELINTESKPKCDDAVIRTQRVLAILAEKRSWKVLMAEGNLRPSTIWIHSTWNVPRTPYLLMKYLVSFVMIRRGIEILCGTQFLIPITDAECHFTAKSLSNMKFTMANPEEALKKQKEVMANRRTVALAKKKSVEAASKDKSIVPVVE